MKRAGRGERGPGLRHRRRGRPAGLLPIPQDRHQRPASPRWASHLSSSRAPDRQAPSREHLAEPPAVDVVDESPDRTSGEIHGCDRVFCDLLPGVLLGVGEAVERGRRDRRQPGLLAEPLFQLAVRRTSTSRSRCD